MGFGLLFQSFNLVIPHSIFIDNFPSQHQFSDDRRETVDIVHVERVFAAFFLFFLDLHRLIFGFVGSFLNLFLGSILDWLFLNFFLSASSRLSLEEHTFARLTRTSVLTEIADPEVFVIPLLLELLYF